VTISWRKEVEGNHGVAAWRAQALGETPEVPRCWGRDGGHLTVMRGSSKPRRARGHGPDDIGGRGEEPGGCGDPLDAGQITSSQRSVHWTAAMQCALSPLGGAGASPICVRPPGRPAAQCHPRDLGQEHAQDLLLV
jgi:hypothetical protein